MPLIKNLDRGERGRNKSRTWWWHIPTKVPRCSMTEVGSLFWKLEALCVFQYGSGFQTAWSLWHTSLHAHSYFRAFADVFCPLPIPFLLVPLPHMYTWKNFCNLSFLLFSILMVHFFPEIFSHSFLWLSNIPSSVLCKNFLSGSLKSNQKMRKWYVCSISICNNYILWHWENFLNSYSISSSKNLEYQSLLI